MNTLTGKITHILEPATGDSKRNPGQKWMRQEFVLETQEMYPRKVCFQVWGEDRIRMADIHMDDVVTIEFDIESREFGGRWYTSINARTVTKGAASAQFAAPQPAAGYAVPGAAQTMPQTNNPFGPTDAGDDLPF